MQTYFPQFALAGVVALLVMLPTTAPGQAPNADPSGQKIFDKLLKAIQDKDRDAFVADATDAVKKETTKEAMDLLEKHVGSRLKGGYEATYLCQLKKGRRSGLPVEACLKGRRRRSRRAHGAEGRQGWQSPLPVIDGGAAPF
jgi:hypothetical protein